MKKIINYILITILLSLFFFYFLVMINLKSAAEHSRWGQFGDAFGLFNGLAFLIAMYALYLQSKEVSASAKARKETTELEKQTAQ